MEASIAWRMRPCSAAETAAGNLASGSAKAVSSGFWPAIAGDEVVVVLDAGEGEHRDERRRLDVDAAELVDRHLPRLEPRLLEELAQVAHHQRLVEGLLLGKAGRVDGLEAGHELARLGELAVDLRLREIAQLIVVALVPDVGGEFRTDLQVILPLLVEQRSQGSPPRLEAGGRSRGLGAGGRVAGEKQ